MGLAVGNFDVTVNGTAATPTGVTEVTGKPGHYVIAGLTALAQADEIVVDLKDATVPGEVANLNGILFRSDEITATVA